MRFTRLLSVADLFSRCAAARARRRAPRAAPEPLPLRCCAAAIIAIFIFDFSPHFDFRFDADRRLFRRHIFFFFSLMPCFIFFARRLSPLMPLRFRAAISFQRAAARRRCREDDRCFAIVAVDAAAASFATRAAAVCAIFADAAAAPPRTPFVGAKHVTLLPMQRWRRDAAPRHADARAAAAPFQPRPRPQLQPCAEVRTVRQRARLMPLLCERRAAPPRAIDGLRFHFSFSIDFDGFRRTLLPLRRYAASSLMISSFLRHTAIIRRYAIY